MTVTTENDNVAITSPWWRDIYEHIAPWECGQCSHSCGKDCCCMDQRCEICGYYLCEEHYTDAVYGEDKVSREMLDYVNHNRLRERLEQIASSPSYNGASYLRHMARQALEFKESIILCPDCFEKMETVERGIIPRGKVDD